MQKKIKKAQIDTKLRKELKAIDKRIAKAKAKYYDLLDLKIACKAIARLEKNGYKNLTTLEDFIKQAGLENQITQATLEEYQTKGLLKNQKHPTLPLLIWNYTEKTQYNQLWDDITLNHRATIRDVNGNLIANSFPKFFNIEENKHSPSQNFEVFEKLDGSFGMLFYYENQWIFCSKGSFTSEQATKGWEILQKYQYHNLPITYSYIFEIIYPSNRIVVNYGNQEELILLAVFDKDKKEYDAKAYSHIFPIVKTYQIQDYTTLVEMQKDNFEGFVIKFDNGTRCKVKLNSYLELHKKLSNISEYKIWELFCSKIDLPTILETIPDEFHKIVIQWYKSLQSQFTTIENNIKIHIQQLPKFDTRKEIALYLADYQYKSIAFSILDNKPIYDKICKLIEPDKKECLLFLKNSY